VATKTLLEVLSWLEDLFDRHGIERSYGGAFARNFYAPPRFTKDLDLLVLMSQIKIPGFVEDLCTAGARRIRTDETTGKEERIPLDLKDFLAELRSQRMVRLDCFGVPAEIFVPWHLHSDFHRRGDPPLHRRRAPRAADRLRSYRHLNSRPAGTFDRR
jgi:hypothetical protein